MNNLPKKAHDDQDDDVTQKPVSTGAGGKEQARFTISDHDEESHSEKKKPVEKPEEVEKQEEPETTDDIELEPEVEAAGVEIKKEEVIVPPDISHLIKQSGASVSVVQDDTSQKAPQLPLTDEQIETGLHSKITSSIRWLAVWCIKQLKKVHITVKEVHGKLVRVQSEK